MANPEFYIYVLFRETGIPFYVGKGKGRRFVRHWWDNPRDRNHHKIAIVRNMLKAGQDVPTTLLHEGLTEAVAFTYEKALIAAIGRADKGLGPLTNMTDGGEGSAGLSAQSLERIGAAQRGKKLSPEHAAKLKASARTRKNSPTRIARFVAAAVARCKSKPMPPEVRAKISAATKGRPKSTETIARMKIARRLRRMGPASPETRAKMSTAHHVLWQARKQAACREAAIRLHGDFASLD